MKVRKMNIKIEALKAITFIAIGGFLFVNYWPKDKIDKTEPQQPTAKSSGKAVAKKVTKANGDIEESLECVTYSELKPSPSVVVKKNYSIGLVGLKEIEALSLDARIGQLPVFVGIIANKNLDQSKLLLRMEF